MPANIAKMRERVHGPLAQGWLDRWQALASAPIGQVIDEMLSTDDEAKEIRQNSPFDGASTQDDRLEAIRRAAA